jgi:hypothetical protein
MLQAGAFGAAYGILTQGIDHLALVNGLVLFLVIATTILCHETAHYWLASRLGAGPFWALGKASIFSYPRRLSDQRLISLAGPLAGAFTALVLALSPWVVHQPLLRPIAWCLAASQLGMLLPFFNDGSLLFTRKDKLNVHQISRSGIQ